MILHPAQIKIASDNHRFRVMRCGRRFGKSSLIAEEIKGIAISKPARIAYIANTYQQARDIVWELFKKELKGATIDTNDSRLEIRTKTLKGGESLVILRGWESVENLRGQAFDFLAIDEVASMRNFWVNWHEVLRPTLTDKQGSVLFASTPQGFNHFYDLCNQELTDDDYKSFHFSSYDNPYLPKDEIDRAKETLPKDRFSQEYLAEFEKTQGLVYKEFIREKHLYDKLLEGHYEKVAGVDPGFRNPAAILTIYVKNDKLYIDEEWYKTGRTDAQIADYVSGLLFQEVYSDPENQGFIQELVNRNVNVREVVKYKGSIENGINRIKEMLLRGDIRINRKCVNLISEFEMYSYDDDKDQKDQNEAPIKAFDHALDALRYVVISKDFSSYTIHQEMEDRFAETVRKQVFNSAK